ncbi:hypothetical protein M9H77_30642 [Catharanthus roseus]|uniref:Uncharacterized protein n=1 Tax=Catharanthus roseus TaxID=4058 RepID=A0ACB9ZXT6_CATRO|nr:hypothetical protein M9H77_30642 [Catharanthus roseus]
MPELGSDGLVLGIRALSVEPHCCITCSFKIWGVEAALISSGWSGPNKPLRLEPSVKFLFMLSCKVVDNSISILELLNYNLRNKVLKVHPFDLVTNTFENGVFEVALKDLDEKLAYPISFMDYLLKRDILKDS